MIAGSQSVFLATLGLLEVLQSSQMGCVFGFSCVCAVHEDKVTKKALAALIHMTVWTDNNQE